MFCKRLMSEKITMRKSATLIVILMILSTGCSQSTSEKGTYLVIASTTSTQDSGLFDRLNPVFEQKTGATVIVVARGTGAAIQYAIDKNADLIFVHSPTAEKKFVEDGYGIKRYEVMYNDFVVLGPKTDPASVRGLGDVKAAFRLIEETGKTGRAKFFSRGDDSGTHKKERSIWKSTGIVPVGKWYISTGNGMGETLSIANEELGYTISDRGTWIKRKDSLHNLEIVVEGPVKGGDELLMNPYGIIAVNPEYNPDANYELAMKYIEFVTGADGQKIIGNYKINGEVLFFPIGR
jgi:tungstate transport system substrate-binding protein